MGIYSLLIKITDDKKELVQVNSNKDSKAGELLDVLASYLLMVSSKDLVTANK